MSAVERTSGIERPREAARLPAADRAREQSLATLPLFVELDAPTLTAVTSMASMRRFERRAVVARRGDAAHEVLVIARGCLRVSRAPTRGPATVFALGPGEVVGESAARDGALHSASVTALDDTVVVAFERARFAAAVQTSASLARALLRAAERRILWLQAQLEERATATISQRVARLLLHLVERQGQGGVEGAVLSIRLSQEDLGELVGTSRESINRVLSAWVGVVEHRERRLAVRDPAALRALAEDAPPAQPFDCARRIST